MDFFYIFGVLNCLVAFFVIYLYRSINVRLIDAEQNMVGVWFVLWEIYMCVCVCLSVSFCYNAILVC